jgi:hypothetical protein
MPAGGGTGSGVTPPSLSSATLATPAVATDLLTSGPRSGGTSSDGVLAEGGMGLVGVGLADDTSDPGGQTHPTENLRPSRWRIWVLAGLLVALVAAPAWAVISAERGSRSPTQPDASPTQAPPPAWLTQDAGLCRQAFAAPLSTDRPPPSSPLPSGPTQQREFAPPAGWSYYRQADGLRIVAPNEWRYARTDSMVCFRDRTHVLGVQTAWSMDGDVTEAMQRLEEQMLRSGVLPGYSPVGMEPMPNFYASSAEWEYTFDGEDGDPLRVRMRGFVTSTGKAYAIFLLTQELDKPFLNTYWNTLLVGFAPARTSST